MAAEPPSPSVFSLFARDVLDAPLLDPCRAGPALGYPILALSLVATRRLLEWIGAARASDGLAFSADISFVDLNEPNAFVAAPIRAEPARHLIGIHSGLAARYIQLAFNVLAHPRCLVGIGDAHHENGSHGDLSNARAAWLGSSSSRSCALGPQDPVRVAAAEDLAHLMLRFVWLHELYHGLNGHVALLRQRFGLASLFERAGESVQLVERSQRRSLGPSPMAKQAMEFDVDRTALWSMFQIDRAGIEPVPSIAARPQKERATLIMLAACLMPAVFPATQDDTVFSETASHPTQGARLHDLIRTFASHVATDADPQREVIHAVLATLDAMRPICPSLPESGQILDRLRDPQRQDELDRIETILNELRRDLGPFAFRPVPS